MDTVIVDFIAVFIASPAMFGIGHVHTLFLIMDKAELLSVVACIAYALIGVGRDIGALEPIFANIKGVMDAIFIEFGIARFIRGLCIAARLAVVKAIDGTPGAVIVAFALSIHTAAVFFGTVITFEVIVLGIVV